jgi:hypothetical protein
MPLWMIQIVILPFLFHSYLNMSLFLDYSYHNIMFIVYPAGFDGSRDGRM